MTGVLVLYENSSNYTFLLRPNSNCKSSTLLLTLYKRYKFTSRLKYQRAGHAEAIVSNVNSPFRNHSGLKLEAKRQVLSISSDLKMLNKRIS